MNETFHLAVLRMGECAMVTKIDPTCAMAARLLDLGLIPGTRVTCVAKSPAGDPCAYLIRGAVIALRRADAAGVGARPLAEASPVREMVAV